MKVYVEQASDYTRKEIREYESLDDCIKDLLNETDFGSWEGGIMISPPLRDDEKNSGCDWVALVYDSYIE